MDTKLTVGRKPLFFDSNGNIWIQGGFKTNPLLHFNTQTERITNFTEDSTIQEHPKGNIQSLFEDKAGIIWGLTEYEGIIRIEYKDDSDSAFYVKQFFPFKWEGENLQKINSIKQKNVTLARIDTVLLHKTIERTFELADS
ncbi:MAG: hypothetical protein AAFR87_02360, partial [Bacteroidota bacterium]